MEYYSVTKGNEALTQDTMWVNLKNKMLSRDFPGGPVVKTPCFHCRGHWFDPWLGN